MRFTGYDSAFVVSPGRGKSLAGGAKLWERTDLFNAAITDINHRVKHRDQSESMARSDYRQVSELVQNVSEDLLLGQWIKAGGGLVQKKNILSWNSQYTTGEREALSLST